MVNVLYTVVAIYYSFLIGFFTRYDFESDKVSDSPTTKLVIHQPQS